MNRRSTGQRQVFATTPIIPRITAPPGAVFFADDRGWTNRMEFQSESGKFYVVSQHAAGRYWGCSCTGWRTHRKCKHLTELGLPNGARPFEATIVTDNGEVASAPPVAAPAPSPVGSVFNATPVAVGREVVGEDEA